MFIFQDGQVHGVNWERAEEGRCCSMSASRVLMNVLLEGHREQTQYLQEVLKNDSSMRQWSLLV